MTQTKISDLRGIAVPLGALYTEKNPVIGEFSDLIPFADFCKKSGIGIIQLLPVNDTGTQSSPYSGLSAFALHPSYIRLSETPGFEELRKKDKIFNQNYQNFLAANTYKLRYNYNEILNSKDYFLRQIYLNIAAETEDSFNKTLEELNSWIKKNPWVKIYAVYKNLKYKYMQASWKSWKKDDQSMTADQIEKLFNNKKLLKDHYFYVWEQKIAEQQFSAAVKAVHEKGILIKGDMPILMNEDSCDTWAYPEFFNQNLKAGSPADGENPAGQNWGFPTYNWKNLKKADYSWWIDRLKSAEKYYDAYRLDHILGFFRIWAIPANDVNALNGHTEPYAAIKKDELYELGFDDYRIRWLSQPHIPTGVIEDITWNHEAAHKILEILCDRIGNEELWLFKKTVTGSSQIFEADFKELCTEDAAERIKEALVNYWSNRSLLEVAKNKFVPLWTYSKSTSWQTLNDSEKSKLTALFGAIDKKNEKAWRKQSDEILTALTGAVKMVPCGEDLGVGIKCVPEIMEKKNILGLRVVRWSRYWEKESQPYVEFENYTPLSVTTTSVHDSSTIRQWWDEEKDSVKAYIKANKEAFGIEEITKGTGINENAEFGMRNAELEDEALIQAIAEQDFSPETAKIIMETSVTSASKWNISPLQDFLYMNKKYWLENAADERINVPGTVTDFNWTYRLPASIEELSADSQLIKKIKAICTKKK